MSYEVKKWLRLRLDIKIKQYNDVKKIKAKNKNEKDFLKEELEIIKIQLSYLQDLVEEAS